MKEHTTTQHSHCIGALNETVPFLTGRTSMFARVNTCHLYYKIGNSSWYQRLYVPLPDLEFDWSVDTEAITELSKTCQKSVTNGPKPSSK